jgi:hypothetical protein
MVSRFRGAHKQSLTHKDLLYHVPLRGGGRDAFVFVLRCSIRRKGGNGWLPVVGDDCDGCGAMYCATQTRCVRKILSIDEHKLSTKLAVSLYTGVGLRLLLILVCSLDSKVRGKKIGNKENDALDEPRDRRRVPVKSEQCLLIRRKKKQSKQTANTTWWWWSSASVLF